MSEEKSTPEQSQTSQENTKAGEQNPSKINVEADYEASKAYSGGVSPEAAEAATAPKFKVPEPEAISQTSQQTGARENFRAMAGDLDSSSSEGDTTVDDDLVKKALDKGQAAQ